MKTFEPNASAIGKQVYRYLNDERGSRPDTRKFICELHNALPETVIFGGMIRDISLGLSRKFNSDIDLVSMADRRHILSAIRSYHPTLNKFGGFRFSVGRQLFDIWSYQDTWAFREGLVKASTFENLCATTFFDIDAVYQPLKTSKIISSASYFESLRTRTLDINLEENPSPHKIADRAISMAINRDLKVSPRLQSFILRNAKNTLWKNGSAGPFLKLMAKHNEDNSDLEFHFQPQSSLF